MDLPVPDRGKSMATFEAGTKSGGGSGLNRNKTMSRIIGRRPSFGFRRISGIKPIDGAPTGGTEFKRPPLIYLNTYQLDPNLPFNVAMVQQVTDCILDHFFKGYVYSIQESPALASQLAGDIMREVKLLKFNRYRIICVVTLAQKRSQSYNNAIAFLWDHERDNYYNTQREVTTAFVQVTVFGIYLD